ncbi:DUF3164 family protein [Raoultella ornithinolytica]|nr:DUF3164 family protein [Raoultella ornithinolytica]
MFDEYCHHWSKGANANLQAIVRDAFQVDKEDSLTPGVFSPAKGKRQDGMD